MTSLEWIRHGWFKQTKRAELSQLFAIKLRKTCKIRSIKYLQGTNRVCLNGLTFTSFFFVNQEVPVSLLETEKPRSYPPDNVNMNRWIIYFVVQFLNALTTAQDNIQKSSALKDMVITPVCIQERPSMRASFQMRQA